jgi:hypothetical protein
MKALLFFLLSPILLFSCIAYAWRHRSLMAGYEKFGWIRDAYFNRFRL